MIYFDTVKLLQTAVILLFALHKYSVFRDKKNIYWKRMKIVRFVYGSMTATTVNVKELSDIGFWRSFRTTLNVLLCVKVFNSYFSLKLEQHVILVNDFDTMKLDNFFQPNVCPFYWGGPARTGFR